MLYKKNIPEEESGWATLYKAFRQPFFKFARKYVSDEEIISDIYQEVFYNFWKQLSEKENFQLTCSLKTYLIEIGKNTLFNYLRQKRKYPQVNFADSLKELEGPEENEEWKETQKKIFPIIQRMKEPCNQLLTLYYWEEKSMKEIAETLGFKNQQVAKSKKYKCMQAVKEKISSLFKWPDK